MNRIPRVLGSLPISFIRQRSLADGIEWSVPRWHLRREVLARAQVGDLLWIKEPWSLFKSRSFGKQNICEPVPGGILNLNIPDHIKPYRHQLSVTRHPASTLARDDSRATLEIVAMDDELIRVRAHMQQVDAFLKGRRAVA